MYHGVEDQINMQWQTAHKEAVFGRVSLVGTTVTPIYVGTSNIKERKMIKIQNASNASVFIHARPTSGDNTAPTQNECARFGEKIKSGAKVSYPAGENITLYASLQSVAGTSGNGFLRISEWA